MRHPLFAIWSTMIQRCTNPRNPKWARYGERGIKVCDRWRVFKHFVEDMGPRPPGTKLERKNNDGHYEPGNCIWADDFVQNVNRSCTVYATLDGRTQHVAAWCRELGLKEATICQRVKRGATVEDALTKPLANRGQS